MTKLRAAFKTGTKEGFVSSYNLFFENGLRLRTDDMTWMSAVDRKKTEEQFNEVIAALEAAGVVIDRN